MHPTKTEAERILFADLGEAERILLADLGYVEQILSADLEYVDMVGDRIRQIAQSMQGQDGTQQPQYRAMLEHIDRLETLTGMLTETIDRLRGEVRAVNEEA